MQIDMADTFKVTNNRHARLVLDTLDQILAASRNHDINPLPHR